MRPLKILSSPISMARLRSAALALSRSRKLMVLADCCRVQNSPFIILTQATEQPPEQSVLLTILDALESMVCSQERTFS